MELKGEYKQTEVGVIPDDWDLKAIASIAEIFGGGTPSTFVKEYWDGEIPWVSAGDVSNADGRFIYETADSITEIGLASSPARILPIGTTIIIARGATVGRIRQLGSTMTFNQTCYGLLPRNSFDKDYLYYSMLFSVPSIKALTFGTIFGTITTSTFQKWMIPVPPFPEQRAIAAALGDVDALIASLDALIAKKRDIKQGAMQELLTGKKRLAGFGGEWEEKTLGDIGEIDSENLKSNTNPNYAFKYIALEDVDRGVLRGYAELTFRDAPSRARRRVRKDDILISTVRPNLKSHLFVRQDIPDLVCSTGFAVLRCNKNIADPAYVYFQIFSHGIERQIEIVLTGSNYPAINGSDVKAFKIPIPSLSEQRAIAEILTDMDNEIVAIEQKRAKYQLLKQGMMQELLTGKTRLL